MFEEYNIAKDLGLALIDRKSESGSRLYTGLARSAVDVHHQLRVMYKDRHQWQQEIAWCDAYRSVWISVSDRAVLTYCEGDLTLATSDSALQFYTELKAAADFYAVN